MENRVQKRDILYELTILDTCQKGANRSNDELELLSERWFEIINLQYVSKDVFHEASIKFQAVNSWFPTVQEIIESVKSVWEDRKRNIKALPGPDFIPPTPEQMAEHRKKLKKIFDSIGKA